MYMRGKLVLLGIFFICALGLCGCTRVIDSPADEIKLYRWEEKFDNGNTVSLSFDESEAHFTANCEDFSLELNGLFILTDDTLIICDTDSGSHDSFAYVLFGDKIELSCNGSVISLKKVKDS